MFDQLLIYAGRVLDASPDTSTCTTHTARLIALLDHQPMTTAELAAETGLTHRKVWGLLKWHRDRGHVSFDPKCGVWQSNTARMTEAIKRAAALLRSNGWKVTPP